MPWWDTDYTTFFNQRTSNKVAIWPLPNGARIDPRFKMVGGDPSCASRASRHLVAFKLSLGADYYFALIDVAYDGTPGELVGDTGEDQDGRVLQLKITDHDLANPHPDYSLTGLNYRFTMSLPGKDDWHTEWFYPQIPDNGNQPAPVVLRNVLGDQGTSYRQNDACTADNAWGNTVCLPVDWYTFSECATPAGVEKVHLENFARFNGDDAYIALTESVSAFNQPFLIECDIRFQEFITWMPIWGNHDAGGFFGMDQADAIFGFLRQATTWVPELNVWYHYEWAFEQIGQLRSQLFMDGNLVLDFVHNRQNMSANRLGVYREGGIGVIWGGFDLKHLWYGKGTPGDFDVQLDMPLQVDALDYGPFANHGTTFNMQLPSV